MSVTSGSERPKVSPLYDPRIRSIAYQVLLCAIIGFLVYAAIDNAATNLAKARSRSGFGFWNDVAGFDISQTLIDYRVAASTYGQALLGRTSQHVARSRRRYHPRDYYRFHHRYPAACRRTGSLRSWRAGYVELFRNIPLLLQLLFWYNAGAEGAAGISRQHPALGWRYLNNRGVFLPEPIPARGFRYAVIALGLGIVGAIAFSLFSRVGGRSKQASRRLSCLYPWP